MSSFILLALPALVIFAMTVVGLELTLADLARVLHYPGHVAAALLSQALLLPAIAAVLILALQPSVPVAGGLILAATAPQATISNYFCLLGRGNVARSVTLTAASSLLALIATPLLSTLAFNVLLDDRSGISLPALPVMRQVATGLLLPIGAGMLIRYYAPAFVERNHVRLQRASLVAIAALLALIVAGQLDTIERNLASIAACATGFTVLAGGIGYGIARALSWDGPDTVSAIAGFPSRSLAIATLVAVNVLGRPDFLAFAATFFIVQALLLVPAMLLAKRAAVRAGASG